MLACLTRLRTGQTHGVDDADRLWSDAAALVQADEDADLRAEAREVYAAEAARCRLVDRIGPGQVRLACGITMAGELSPGEAVTGLLALLAPDGRLVLVAERAVVLVVGTASALRVESDRREPTLGQWLREAWGDGDPVRALDATGEWHAGPVVFVGADHAVIESVQGPMVLPMRSVQAWSR